MTARTSGEMTTGTSTTTGGTRAGTTPGEQSAQTGGEGRAQQAAGNAQEMAQQKAREVADQAQDTANQAGSKLREQLDERSSQVAEQINQQASDLRAVSQSLREQGKDGPASAADRLAQYAERVGGYLRDNDSDALLSDAEDFGRRQPWAVGAGAVALGFAAARFLKASSGKRYATRYPSTGRSPQRPGEDFSGVARSPMPPATAALPAIRHEPGAALGSPAFPSAEQE